MDSRRRQRAELFAAGVIVTLNSVDFGAFSNFRKREPACRRDLNCTDRSAQLPLNAKSHRGVPVSSYQSQHEFT